MATESSAFSKKLGRLSAAGPEILAFGSHSMVNSQTILDCFVPNFKLKYENSENIKTDCVNTIVFNLVWIKSNRGTFSGHPMSALVINA